MQKTWEETLLTCVDGLPSGQSIEPRVRIETLFACMESGAWTRQGSIPGSWRWDADAGLRGGSLASPATVPVERERVH
jgi:hypothetical protein